MTTNQPSRHRTKEENDRLLGELVVRELQERREGHKEEWIASEARAQRKQSTEELRARLARIQSEAE